MYRCPSCGSEDVVWDYQRGEVICSSCGLVIDTIYYTARRFSEKNESSERKVLKAVSLRRESAPGVIVKAYSKFFSWWRLRKNLEIDRDLLLRAYEGSSVSRVIRHIKDSKLEKLLQISPTLKKVFNYIDLYPRLSSRTFRAKVLVSYLLLREAYGTPISLNMLSRAFSISRNHLLRIRKEIKRYPEIQKLIRDLDIDESEILQIDLLIKDLATDREELTRVST
ncbi:MAG: TFIIB-type zinc ribbon-containing protein [Sulfolobales archaeon]